MILLLCTTMCTCVNTVTKGTCVCSVCVCVRACVCVCRGVGYDHVHHKALTKITWSYYLLKLLYQKTIILL